MRRRPTHPTRFRCRVAGQESTLLALPPDESDPATDYRWVIAIEGREDGPTGSGFTSHQAVHDLIERAAAGGVTITDVIQLREG